jgi:hypothetical protein
MSDLVFEQKIDLPYVYTAGAVQREALTGLREGRLIASAGEEYVAVPATPFSPDGAHLRETRELPAEGVLEAATVAHHRPGTPAYGLIRIDGASHTLLHRLSPEAARRAPGSRVRAVWREDRSGSYADIEFFVPADR